MKKTITLVLALILCLSLAAPASAADSPFVGNWKIYSMEGDMPVSHEELAGSFMDSIAATLHENGKLSVNLFGEVVEDVWTDSGDGTGVFNINGYACQMFVRDGFLWVDMGAGMSNAFYVFEKSARSAEELAESTVIDWGAVSEEYSYQPPEEEKSDSLLVGSWRFYSREGGDGDVPHDALPKLLEEGRDYANDLTLTIEPDGWFKITDFYGFEQNTWTDTGDDTAALNADGQNCILSIEDGLLVLRAPDSVTRYEKTFAIGTTGYFIVVPADFTDGGIPEEALAEGQLAFCYSPRRRFDFGIFQFSREGRGLMEHAEIEAKEYGADSVESVSLNGVPAALYYSWENDRGFDYRTANYIFEAGDDFGELCFWADDDEAEALAAQIAGSLTQKKLEPEDLKGVVVEKLAGDFFPDRYLVKADNGELCEGEYIGFEDLEPGDRVELSWRGKGWWIDEEFDWSWPDDKPETPAGVYTTADGIVVDELSVQLAGGRVWSFGYALHNTTDETKSFDPSPFVLKTADGTEIKTAAPYVSADEIWANNVTRSSTTILSPDLIQLGDEISFWYDGAYLGTVIAEEF